MEELQKVPLTPAIFCGGRTYTEHLGMMMMMMVMMMMVMMILIHSEIRSIANSEEHTNFVDPFRQPEKFSGIVHIFLSLESKLSMIFEASQRFGIPGGFHVDSHGFTTLDLSGLMVGRQP